MGCACLVPARCPRADEQTSGWLSLPEAPYCNPGQRLCLPATDTWFEQKLDIKIRNFSRTFQHQNNFSKTILFFIESAFNTPTQNWV